MASASIKNSDPDAIPDTLELLMNDMGEIIWNVRKGLNGMEDWHAVRSEFARRAQKLDLDPKALMEKAWS